MEPLLEVENLSKAYGPGCPRCLHGQAARKCPACGTLWALRDIQFQLYPSEILGIMGESGSGKSTLLRCLYLDDAPTTGRMVLPGCADPATSAFDLDPARRRALQRQCLGMVHQDPREGLNFRLSCGGNIAERLLASGERRFATIRAEARFLLERLRAPAERMDETPHSFSGGMRQRVQIAKALAPRPSLLLLDEITTGLDTPVQARLLDLVTEIHEEWEVAIIVVSHHPGIIRALASRTLVMCKGTIIESGLTDRVLEDPREPYTQELVHAIL